MTMRIRSYSSLLLLVLCCLSTLSCKHEEVTSTTPHPTPSTEDSDRPSFKVQVDLGEIPVLAPEARTIVSTSSDDATPAPGQGARAFTLTVPTEASRGNYPKLAFAEGDQIPVRLLLYPERYEPGTNKQAYYGQKVFYSKGTVNLTVEKGKVKLKEKGVEFEGGEYRTASGQIKPLTFTGGIAKNNEDVWRMTAIYVPGIKDMNGHIINFEGKAPLRFLNPGETLIVGTDINIPFVLGMVTGQGKNAVYTPGVPVTLGRNTEKIGFEHESNPSYNDPANYSFTIKKVPGVGFYPAGTLLAFRFRNDMKSLQDLHSEIESEIWAGSNGSYERLRKTYDYKIDKVSIRTTSSKGIFDIGKSVEFTPQEVTTYSFETTQALGSDGRDTPWLYVWQSAQHGVKDNLLEITFDLENVDLGIKTHRKVYRATIGTLASGHKYFKNVALSHDLRLPPLSFFGPTFMTNIDGDATWGEPWVKNAEQGKDHTDMRGIGRSYLAKELFDNNGRLTNTFFINPQNDAPEYVKKSLRWKLPTLKEVNSIFPPSILHLSAIDKHHYPAQEEKTFSKSQEVIINGEKIADDALYLTRGGRDLRGQNQESDESLRVYYALRYVGTKYVSAWRYIELGRWNSGPRNPQNGPKFIIQSRNLPLNTGATYDSDNRYWVYNEAQATTYLKDVIAKNEFWSDNVANGDQNLTVLNCYSNDPDLKILKPDVLQRVFPLVGVWPKGSNSATIGQAFAFWLKPSTNSTRNAQAFEVSNTKRSTLAVKHFDNGYNTTTNARAMILPMVAPGQPGGH